MSAVMNDAFSALNCGSLKKKFRDLKYPACPVSLSHKGEAHFFLAVLTTEYRISVFSRALAWSTMGSG